MVSSPNSIPILTQTLPEIAAEILDPDVSEIMINADGRVYIERAGHLSEVVGVQLRDEKRHEAAIGIARHVNRDISPEEPITHVRLENGSRVAIALAPVSVGGTALSIRKFQQRFFSLEGLVAADMLSAEQAALLRAYVRDRLNLLVIGGTGTGKTSVANALANEIDPTQRLAIIEDTMEMQVNHPNIFRIECRTQRHAKERAVTAFDAVTEAALRFRPDRIIVGEVRGPEAFALLRAWTSGHEGSLSTIHADTIGQGLQWLALLALTGTVSAIPYPVLRRFVRHAVHVAILLKKDGDQRRVVEIRRLRKKE